MLVVLGLLLWLFWYFFHTEVRDAVRWIRYGEMWIFSWFIDDDFKVMHRGDEIVWQRGFKDAGRFGASDLTYAHLSYFATLAMAPMKKIFIAILIAAAMWCMFLGPNTEFRKKYDLETLIEKQSRHFRITRPFVKFNPQKMPSRAPGSPVPAELPLFSEALGPEEWLAYNSIPIKDKKIDETATAEAFRVQLGERWKGPMELAPYKQIFLAIFCLKASRKRSDADDMLGRFAICWDQNSGLRLGRDSTLLRDARRVLKDKNIAGKTLSQCNRHAYETTALLRALAFAREEGGVLAPAQFVWLRGHDRSLWYPLNNLGRQSLHPEAMGAMSHYKAERMTQRPIPVPKVDDAVKTIREYMASFRARAIPQLDYKNSKKRGVKKAV